MLRAITKGVKESLMKRILSNFYNVQTKKAFLDLFKEGFLVSLLFLVSATDFFIKIDTLIS